MSHKYMRMSSPLIFHLFNAFQIGGAERQHMEHVKRLAGRFRQVCWAPCSGPLETELDAICVEHHAGGPDVALNILEQCRPDCIVIRTNWHFDDIEPALARNPAPVLFIKEYLRWYQGNNRYIDPEYDRRAMEMADQVLFTGPSLKRGWEALDLCCKLNGMLPNGVDTSAMPMKPRSSANKPMRAGMLGNIIPRKNQTGAIKALRNRLASGETLLVLGGAFHHEEYASKVREEAHGLSVRMTGYVDAPRRFLEDIDVLLNTSMLEGWPVSLMEAMACGIPVIAPAIGDIPELLAQGEAGLLYPPDDIAALPWIVEQLEDPAVYHRYSCKGVERVNQFDINVLASKLAQTINALIEKHTSR